MNPAGPHPSPAPTAVLRHGTIVTFTETAVGPRRSSTTDRHGTPLTTLSWNDDGSLSRASTRIPDGSWLTVEPRAMHEPAWGFVDRLWHDGAPITVFASLDYAHITVIPPLAEPARLPPGGGTAVLNMIAELAADQGARVLAYRGPYPTEQLFLALLESFRADATDDPLGAFMAERLTWRPAPHERVFGAELYVQWRDGIEKVGWRGRTYYRPVLGGVRRRASRRLRDAGGEIVCSLWALDAPLEDHLRLDAHGDLVEIGDVPRPAREVIRIPAVIGSGIAAVVAAQSAAALEPYIREAARDLSLEWGPVDHDLVEIEDRRARFSNRLWEMASDRLSLVIARADQLTIALATLSELAQLLGDELRRRGQRRLLALGEAEQVAALERPQPCSAAAGEIAAAVAALLESAKTRLRTRA